MRIYRWIPRLLLSLGVIAGGAAAPGQTPPGFQPPTLPFGQGTGTTAPWGGPVPAKRIIDAQFANAASGAMNLAWQRANLPNDAIVAIPVHMIVTDENENGDGQLNATMSFESWNGTQGDGTVLPPLIATWLRYPGSSDLISFTLAPKAFSNGATSLTIRYPSDSGEPVTVAVPISSPGSADWKIPDDLTLQAPIGRKTFLASLDNGKSWLPILFHLPVRAIGELTSPPTTPGSGPTFMDSIPKPFLFFKDGHYILDHENVSVLKNPGSSAVPFDRLNAKQKATVAHAPTGGFSTPYDIAVDATELEHGLHDRIPSTPGGKVNNGDPSSYILVSVGDFWNWTPFSNDQNLIQPMSVHYLCLDKRIPSLENAADTAKSGGVTSGANWHRVHLDFTQMGGADVPLGGSESFLNDLESRSLFVGYATANANIDTPPGGYAFGLQDVANFRFIRPGEIFVTPNSGTAIDSSGNTVDQSVFHSVFAYQPDAPVCVESWTPPCTPDSTYGFACGQTPVDINVKSAVLPAGTKLAFAGTAQFAINVGDRPFLSGATIDGPALNGSSQELTPGAVVNGAQSWHTTLSLPQSMLVKYTIVLQPPTGSSSNALSGSFSVPVSGSLNIDVPGQVAAQAGAKAAQ